MIKRQKSAIRLQYAPSDSFIVMNKQNQFSIENNFISVQLKRTHNKIRFELLCLTL